MPAVIVPPVSGTVRARTCSRPTPTAPGPAVLAGAGRAGAPRRRHPELAIGPGLASRSSASPARRARRRPRTCSPRVLAAARRRRRPARARSTTSSGTRGRCCAPTPETDYLVLEISARGPGHIAALAAVAPPRIGVVLNVGIAHLGEFGSREAIAQAKGELVEALPATGWWSSTPTTRWWPRWRSARRPAWCASAAAPDGGRPGGRRAPRRRRARAGSRWSRRAGATPVRLAAARRPPGRQRAVRGRRRAGVRRRPRHGRRAPRRPRRPVSRWRMEVTGARRRHRRQRRLQRQPGVDARRAARRWPRIGRAAARWAVLGEMAELGDDAIADA